ncbi:MAG: hypothetical protein JXB00_13975 [Bacteroidales bacterium]|nr:hypothetical protein [Bacteroidales bacterium]
MGFKVIKPDGRIIKVNPEQFEGGEIKSNSNTMKYKKAAIPDLSVGDIIDYYYCYETKIGYSGSKVFDPVYYPLVDDFPILLQKINIYLDQHGYLAAKSLNGAPDFTETIDSEGNYYLRLIDNDRERAKESEFVFPYREYPLIKLQAYYLTSTDYSINSNLYLRFFGKAEKIKSAMNINSLPFICKDITSYISAFEQIMILVALQSYVEDPFINMVNNISAKLGEKGIDRKDHKKYATEAYYILRELYFRRVYFKEVSDGKVNEPINLNNFTMTKILSILFTKKKIPHDIIFTVPNKIADLEDLLFLDELITGIRVSGTDSILFTNISPSALHTDINSDFQGNRAYAVQQFPKGFDQTKIIEIPVDDCGKNFEKRQISVAFNEEMDSCLIKEEISLSGLTKNLWDTLVVTDHDMYNEFIKSDYFKLMAVDQFSNSFKKMGKNINVYVEQEDAYRRTMLDEYYKSMYCEKMNLTEFKLIKPGMWEDQQELIFKAVFNTGDLVLKVADDYLFEIGQLAGCLDFEEIKDTLMYNNTYLPYPKSIEYSYQVTVPEGYMPLDIESIKNRVENEYCLFSYNTHFDKGVINVNIEEKYYTVFIPRNEQYKFYDVLKAKNDFSNLKVLLKKL